MTALSETAADHQMVPEYGQIVPEYDQVVPEEHAQDLAAPVADDSQSPGPTAVEYRTAVAPDSAVAEPGAGEAEADPPAPAPAPESMQESPVAADGGSSGARWHEIQATFVDDPRSCVELAARIVGDSIEALVVSVRERQHSLLSAWQSGDAGTEELRIALQQYRTFWNRLEDFSGTA